MEHDKFQELAEPVINVYLSIEEEILVNIAKALKKHQSLLTEEGYQAWQLEQLNGLRVLTEQNVKTIAEYADMTMNQVEDMLEKAGYSIIEQQEPQLQAGVAAGALMAAPNLSTSPALQQVMETYIQQAQNSFNLVNTTMLGQAEQAYLDIINQTVGNVLAGTMTPQEALRRAVQDWAARGIPALIDKAGRRWSTEAYVKTVSRSMSNNVANEMQDKRFEEYGVDLIETSSHMGARPKCYPYQGKIFSISGSSRKYPAFTTTSYGQPDGLFGINCRHVKYPFIPGVTTQRFPQYNQDDNEEAYEQQQKQRYLERRIRHAKREKRMMEAMGDDEGVNIAKRKIRNRQADMRAFIDDSGQTRQRQNEQIYA